MCAKGDNNDRSLSYDVRYLCLVDSQINREKYKEIKRLICRTCIKQS